MTYSQFIGIIKTIKALILKDVPKEELIGYLDQLAQGEENEK